MLIRNLKTAFANISLHSKLLIYFALICIVPILLIGWVSYTISFNVTREMAIRSSESMVDRANSEIDKLLLDTFTLSEMIAVDPSIQQILRKPIDIDIAKRYSTDLMMDTRLQFIQDFRKDVFGFYVISSNGGKYKSSYRSLKNSDLRDTDWYRRIAHASGPVWFGPHFGSFAAETTGQSLISVGLSVKDRATGEVTGVVLVDIEEKMIMDIIKSKLVKAGYMMILDERNDMLLYPASLVGESKAVGVNQITETIAEHKAEFNENNLGEKTFGGNRDLPLMVYKESSLTGWKIVGIIPFEELTKESKQIGYIIVVMLLIISVIAFLSAWTVAGSVAKPLKKMMNLMKKVEAGDLSVSMNVKHNDEIGKLGNSFNVMIGEIKNLMDKVLYEQNELRKAELKALQAQINPHFLYNTLDSIIWMARADRREDVVRMVSSLTKLFRISISRGKDIITVRDEMEHISSYMTIQHIRYKNKFTYEIQIPESLFKYNTLKLILQPLVENAIYHGIKQKRDMGHISIFGREDEDCIVLQVVDTGAGMTKEQLEALENTLNNIQGEKVDSYGVKNVHERIKIFFGAQYGLRFYSEYGVGTSVEVKIPKMLGGEEVVKSIAG
ncbi:MAG: sensor histidine kinase [Clostridia bacterium]|nr:sensor histidine kinase [Clostridia bacterium]